MAAAAPSSTTFTCYTWNSQGDPSKAGVSKETIVKYFGDAVDPPSVLFLQEGGSYSGDAQGFGTQGSGTSVGSFNERCTTHTLLNPASAKPFDTTKGKEFPVIDKDSKAVVAGGVAGRAPGALALGQTLFISWHSAASSDNTDTSTLIKAIQKAPAVYKAFNVILIGGDFNAAPAAVQKLLDQPANSGPFTGTVLSCGKPTHKTSKKELDFFILLTRGAAIKPHQGPDLVAAPESDHYAVSVQLNLPIN